MSVDVSPVQGNMSVTITAGVTSVTKIAEFERSKLESRRNYSVTGTGDPLLKGFPQTFMSDDYGTKLITQSKSRYSLMQKRRKSMCNQRSQHKNYLVA